MHCSVQRKQGPNGMMLRPMLMRPDQEFRVEDTKDSDSEGDSDFNPIGIVEKKSFHIPSAVSKQVENADSSSIGRVLYLRHRNLPYPSKDEESDKEEEDEEEEESDETESDDPSQKVLQNRTAQKGQGTSTAKPQPQHRNKLRANTDEPNPLRKRARSNFTRG